MSRNRKRQPEAVLAQRSLETGQPLREGEFESEIESDGDTRVVRVKDAEGKMHHTLARFPASDARSRLLPDWAPFITNTGCMLTETHSRRLLVFHILSGPPERMRGVATRLAEILEELGLRESDSFRRPDGSLDRDALAAFVRAAEAQIPPECDVGDQRLVVR